MTTMATHVIRLWELDDERAPTHLVGTLRLDTDGMGSFVELSPNYIEPKPIEADPITIYPTPTVESMNVTLIGDVANRFGFDTARTYALEVWAAMNCPAMDPDDPRWAYLVIPAMRRPVALSTVTVESRDREGKPVYREVDQAMTRDGHGHFVTEGAFGADDWYPAVCLQTDGAGHKWGTGPAPTAYTAEGTPAFLPDPLAPSSMYLQMITNMSPADALEYPKATEDA